MKLEIRNPKQYRKINDQKSKPNDLLFLNQFLLSRFKEFEHSNLEFVSYFVFRTSDFKTN